jgi:hypothetical protein
LGAQKLGHAAGEDFQSHSFRKYIGDQENLVVAANYMQNPDLLCNSPAYYNGSASPQTAHVSCDSIASSPTNKSVKFKIPEEISVSPAPGRVWSQISVTEGEDDVNQSGLVVVVRHAEIEHTNSNITADTDDAVAPSSEPKKYWRNLKSLFSSGGANSGGGGLGSTLSSPSVPTASSASSDSVDIHTIDRLSTSDAKSDTVINSNSNSSPNLSPHAASTSLAPNRLLGLRKPSTESSTSPNRSPLTPFHEVSYASKMFDNFSSYEPVNFEVRADL